MDVEFQVLRSVYLGGEGSYYGGCAQNSYRSNRGHFEGSKKIGGVTKPFHAIPHEAALREPLKTLKMFRLERRRHRNMVAVVSCPILYGLVHRSFR